VAHDDIDTRANPSGAPVAGGATTPGSRFGGHSLQARTFRLMARVGRRMTAIAYRNLRRLEGWRTRQGQAGAPNRVAGGPAPHEMAPEEFEELFEGEPPGPPGAISSQRGGTREQKAKQPRARRRTQRRAS
jgi:hypothetical protein